MMRALRAMPGAVHCDARCNSLSDKQAGRHEENDLAAGGDATKEGGIGALGKHVELTSSATAMAPQGQQAQQRRRHVLLKWTISPHLLFETFSGSMQLFCRPTMARRPGFVLLALACSAVAASACSTFLYQCPSTGNVAVRYARGVGVPGGEVRKAAVAAASSCPAKAQHVRLMLPSLHSSGRTMDFPADADMNWMLMLAPPNAT